MDPFTLLVVAIVCVAVGYVAGLLIGSLGKNRSKGKNATPSEPAPAAVATTTEPATERIDLAQFFRPVAGGPLAIQVGSQSWEAAAELPDGQRALLEGLLNEFHHWLKPMEAVEIPAGAGSSSAAGSVFILPQSQPAAAPSYKPPFIEAKTIVAQIDEILQDMLVSGPMADRKIRLLEMPNQGVVVLVDHDQYPGIDAVPDPEIRTLIRQAVSSWEAKAV